MGSARLGITVAETLRRNRKITRTTSATVSTQRELHVVHRFADGFASGRRWMSRLTDGGICCAELRQQLLDAVDDFDGVGAGLALDIS